MEWEWEEENRNLVMEGNVETETDERKDPLKNPLILGHIFRYLPLNDIKSCRRVCKQWNAVSTFTMEKMSVVALHSDKSANASQVEARCPKAFKEFSTTSGVTFTAFKLKPRAIDPGKWSFVAVNRFFEDQKETMRELTIDNINVTTIRHLSHDHEHEEVYYFDEISLQLRSDHRHFSLDTYIENHLTHLAIDNSNGSKFIVSTHKLLAAKSLSFKHCALEVVNNRQLSPEKLEISRVAIMKGKRLIETFAVNDLVDFKNLKELTLDGTIIIRPDWCLYHYKTSKLTIETRKMALKNLSLKSVTIGKLKDSEWKISGLFKLRNVPYENYTKINFTEMDFGDSTINLAALPLSVEKLAFSKLENESTKIICPRSPRVTLPNLKYLQILTHSSPFCKLCRLKSETKIDFDEGELHYENNFLHSLTIFAHCNSLTTLKLLCNCDPELDLCLSTSWIPPSIKHITLIGDIRAVGKEIKIEKLVLQNDNLDNLATCLKKLQSDHLILDLDSKELDLVDLEDFIVSLIKKPYKTLAIGSLTTNILFFQKSSFSHFVDHRAENYIFEKRKGKSIEKWEFEKLKEQK